MIMARKRSDAADPPEHLTVEQVAHLFGYNVKYTYDLVRQGAIPKVQRAKWCRIMIPRRELKRQFPNLLRDP